MSIYDWTICLALYNVLLDHLFILNFINLYLTRLWYKMRVILRTLSISSIVIMFVKTISAIVVDILVIVSALETFADRWSNIVWTCLEVVRCAEFVHVVHVWTHILISHILIWVHGGHQTLIVASRGLLASDRPIAWISITSIMTPISFSFLDEVVVCESQSSRLEITLLLLWLVSLSLVNTMNRITCIARSVQKLGLVTRFLWLSHVFMIVVFLWLWFLVWKLELISLLSLLPLSNIWWYYFSLFTSDTRLLILILASVDLIANDTTNAVLEIWRAVVLLRVLLFLLSHRMLLWGGCVRLLDHDIRLILRIDHSSPTDTWFSPQLLVCISFSNLAWCIAMTFLFNVFEFLLTCQIGELSKFWSRVAIYRSSHSLVLFKNGCLMYLLELM